jgi:valyl-tRNA synthetase
MTKLIEENKPYDPKDVEGRIYKFWEDNNLFNAQIPPEKEVFSMVMPPPNITGALHLGHALDLTLSDVIVRFNHLIDKNVLWVPGIDQAGIATQNVVEKELAKKGISRETLGREKFIDEVWNWKKNYGERIINQIKLLGVATDWSKLRFTKDEKYEVAVREAFVHYYKKGLIYKGKRIINYCPRCETAISDIEVDYIDEKGELYFIKYLLEDLKEFIIVATTRPETLLGDTAVAVNPDDERYKHLIGKYAILPIVGRKIPIIADEAVDPSFGTGAVKVTPAHDPTDFEIGKRHGLEEITILEKGKFLNENALQFKGLTVDQARKEIVEELKKENLLDHAEPYTHSVGTCERCGSKIEPIISDQWFLKTKELSYEAVKRVKAGEVKFKPERWEKIFLDWMENIQDWCISRQIWWGIQIPVWYCNDCGELIVSVETPKKCNKCGSDNITQDSDVLDTWFGSALWPFASMGWPEDNLMLKNYYPTSLLITGFDIIFFWVARMIFSAIEFTDTVPFKEVLLHGLIRDKYGKKMSKSLNNVIDPTEIINNYGADALRFSLIISSSFGGQDINFDIQKVISSRNFINKVWNAGRFVLSSISDSNEIDNSDLSIWDKWILNGLNITANKVKDDIQSYKINEGGLSIYNFFWDDFCDWYIEESKINLNKFVLKKVFEASIIILHPFMPFVTEELWQTFRGDNNSILNSNFPLDIEESGLIDEGSLKEVELLKEVIKAIRNLKNEFSLLVNKEAELFFTTTNKNNKEIIGKNIDTILRLAKIKSFIFSDSPPKNSVTSNVQNLNIYLPIQEISNVKKEIEIKQKKLEKSESELKRLKDRFESNDFKSNAPSEVILETKERILNIEKEIEQLKSRLKELSNIF